MKGTVEASLMQYDALVNWKLAEVAQYGIWAPVVCNSTHYMIMNLNTWNSLPPAVQAIIEQVNAETIDIAAPLWDRMGQEGIEYALGEGMEFYELDPETLDAMSAKTMPVVEKWLGDVKALGLPGDAAWAKMLEIAAANEAKYGS